MATTRDYFGYLNDQIDIAPANSQEELQAAEVIASLMEEHGLETRLQEFDTPASGKLPYRIVMIFLALGVFLAGFHSTPAMGVGIALIVISAVLLVLKYFGTDVLSEIGPRARSQNVVAVHRAEGPLVAKGNRPIVIVAHYDTPHESFLALPPIARFVPLVRRFVPAFVVVSGLFALLQSLPFIPMPARRVLWVVALLAAVPLLAIGAEAIYLRFSSCTDGANDNKSGVAAMLGVMGRVRPGTDAAEGFATRIPVAPEPIYEEPEDEEAAYGDEYDEDELYDELDEFVDESVEDDIDEDVDEPYADEDELFDDEEGIEDEEPDEKGAGAVPAFMAQAKPAVRSVPQIVTERYEEVEGVRHGAEVLSSLRVLPTSCEVTYAEPQLLSKEIRPQITEQERLAEEAVIAPTVSRLHRSEQEFEEPEEGIAFLDKVRELFGSIAERAKELFASIGAWFGSLRDRIAAAREERAAAETEDESAYADEADVETYEEDVEFDDFGFEVEDEEFDEFDEFDDAPLEDADDIDEPLDSEPVVDEYEPEEVVEVPSEAAVDLGATVASEALTDVDLDDTGANVVLADVDLGATVASAALTDIDFDEPESVVETMPEPVDEYEEIDGEPIDDYDDLDDFDDDYDGRYYGIFEEAPQTEEASAEADADATAYVQAVEDEVPTESDDDDSVAEVMDAFVYEAIEVETSDDDLDEPDLDAPLPEPLTETTLVAEPLQVVDADEIEADVPVDTVEAVDVAEPTDIVEAADEPADAVEEDADVDEPTGIVEVADEPAEVDEPASAIVPEEAADVVEPADAVEDDAGVDEPTGIVEVADEPAEADEPASAIVPEDSADVVEPAEPVVPVADETSLAPGLAFEEEADPTEEELSQRDISGLDASVVPDIVVPNVQPPMAAPSPEPVDDPSWGKSEYVPPRRNVARRAALLDIPDPATSPVDPLSSDAGSTATNLRRRLQNSFLFDDEPEDGSGKSGSWKGGAALREGLRPEEGEELPEETREEMTEAVLSMSDDELIAHDVWFVALGGSTLNHAGMKEFLKEYRSQIRGCLLVNLNCVGAGDLSVLTREGLLAPKRTNRRMERLLVKIASDLHIPLRKAAREWDDTDATDAMRRTIRAITIAGLDEGGADALSQTANDVATALDPGQMTDVTDMVTELIRRA